MFISLGPTFDHIILCLMLSPLYKRYANTILKHHLTIFGSDTSPKPQPKDRTRIKNLMITNVVGGTYLSSNFDPRVHSKMMRTRLHQIETNAGVVLLKTRCFVPHKDFVKRGRIGTASDFAHHNMYSFPL